MTDTTQSLAPSASPAAPTPGRRGFRFLARNFGGIVGIAICLAIIGIAVFAPMVVTRDPVAIDFAKRFAPPSISWAGFGDTPFGADQLGRDIWSRVAYGARVTLVVSLAALLISCVVGVTLGLLAGYFGGIVDRVIMRLTDIQMAFPMMLLALMVVAVLGANMVNLTLVLALIGWTRFARVVRGETLSLRERDFMVSARAIGAGNLRILLRHLLPNLATPVIVVATLELARLVLLEASLNFLGLGVPPPAPSWGRMLADGRLYLQSDWWVVTFPGVAIAFFILGVTMVGDWMRIFYDPKVRTGR